MPRKSSMSKKSKRSVSKKSKRSISKKSKRSISKKSKRSISKKSRGKGITRSDTQATLFTPQSFFDDPLLYNFAKSITPKRKPISIKPISIKTIVPSVSQKSLPISYTEEDENKLFRKQYLEKQKSYGPFQKIKDYFKYRGVQVGKKL